VSQACPLFLVIPGASSTPFSPLSSARSQDRAPSSNRFRIAAYLDPQMGPQGTWERDIWYQSSGRARSTHWGVPMAPKKSRKVVQETMVEEPTQDPNPFHGEVLLLQIQW